MADFTSILKRLTDLADSILSDLNSLEDLKIIQSPNDTYDLLNALENFTKWGGIESTDLLDDTVNHALLETVRYHLEGTVLIAIGIVGMFGKTFSIDLS